MPEDEERGLNEGRPEPMDRPASSRKLHGARSGYDEDQKTGAEEKNRPLRSWLRMELGIVLFVVIVGLVIWLATR